MQSAKLIKAVVSRTAAPSRSYSKIDPKSFKVTTYNDLPSPQGSWQTQYDANQRKYNAHLIFGIASVVGSIVIAKASGLLYLNYSMPDHPAPRD